MFKQEDYILNPVYSPPNSNMTLEEGYIINGSPTFNIDINDINVMPMMSDGIDTNMLMQLSPLEDTMDAAAKFQTREFRPVSPRGPPERTVFAGDVDFQVEINAQDTHRKKYLYSNQLNRIYVDMKMNFPVTFRWKGDAVPSPAYVRACAVFSDESQAEKRVERCTQHTHDASNSNISPEIVKNVLHSSREMGTHGVYYCGIPELADSWYSVLVEMGPTGGSHAYQFVCKNSCSSGINRRATDIIFTLEDANGHVYGRQTVGARSCSCPRRDMVRDQETEGLRHGKKRLLPTHSTPGTQEPRTKKVKIEAIADDSVITLPPLQIIGARAAVTGLEVMLSMMQQAADLKRNDTVASAAYDRSIQALRDKIDELRK